MRKRTDSLLQFKARAPSKSDIHTGELQAKKDTRSLGWFTDFQLKKLELIDYRERIGLPIDGIQPLNKSFTSLEELENYPTISEFPQLNLKELRRVACEILRKYSLSSRYFESIKSILIFGEPLTQQPPMASPHLVIRDIQTGERELFIRVYPGITKDDFRSAWYLVNLYQQQLLPKKRLSRWKLIKIDEERSIEERVVYIQVFKNTVLQDLNNPIFRRALSKTFQETGFTSKRSKSWNIEKARMLINLDAREGSDWDKAEVLYGNERSRNAVKKLRQQTRQKL